MIALPENAKPSKDQKIILGIRPEDISFDESSDLNVSILVAEYVGHHKNIVAQIGDATITITTRTDQETTVGGSYKIRVDQGKIHLFDAESGEVV